MNQVDFVIYILLIDHQRYRVSLAINPQFELNYISQSRDKVRGDVTAYVLTKPLPLGLAKYIYKEITTVRERKGARLSDLFKDIKELQWEYKRRIKEALDYYSLSESARVEKIKPKQDYQLPPAGELKEVHRILAGRLLYYDEIQTALAENRVELNTSLLELLQGLKLESKLQVKPSVAYREHNHLVCQRCGQDKKLVKIDCNYCGLSDYYCDNCIYMGKARSCRPLYAFVPLKKLNRVEPRLKPELRFDLTSAQTEASHELVNFISSQQDEALVWAVCGAGKTEVSFHAIAQVLSRGGDILFAIPRKDAVIELAPRLKESFPDFKVSTLHGGSETKYDLTRITVATTHQVLRFINNFDLVILDEMDAFPYRDSQMLKTAVQRACHWQGKIIYMTATPDANLADFKEVSGKRLIKIPARYHGHPVPVPELLTVDLNYDQQVKEVELTKEIFELIQRSVYRDLAQLFIFLPTRELVELVGGKLQSRLPEVNGQSWVQYSHARDPARNKKREQFLQGEYPILVSTTIMERAITIPKANVLVLFADWNFVFDVPTLIQMAGRAGRSLEYPEGRVWFGGQKITKEMEQAQSRIQSLNEEAKRKGYLKESKLIEE